MANDRVEHLHHRRIRRVGRRTAQVQIEMLQEALDLGLRTDEQPEHAEPREAA